jgi:pentatricopeptide repeat protein
VKCYQKCKDSNSVQDKLKSLSERIQYIETFVSARTLAKSNPSEMFRICEQLLQEYDIEVYRSLFLSEKKCFVGKGSYLLSSFYNKQRAVRSGDIFALMIEAHYANGSLNKARDLLHLMQTRVSASNLDYYLVWLDYTLN